MRYVILFITLLHAFNGMATCTLPAPNGLKTTSVASCQVSLKWKKVNAASEYVLQYKPSAAADWITVNGIGNVTTYNLAGLSASTSYDIRIASVCSSSETGAFSTPINTGTTACSVPVDLAVTGISATAATANWQPVCGENKFSVRYRIKGTSAWTTVGNVSAESYQLEGLMPSTIYQVRVRAKCGSQPSEYSAVVEFSTLAAGAPSRKNVLLVIIDDARFDTYQANGGPPFFNDINISRVSDEGVNFKLSFPAQSQCAPSRASITSGLYPHLHGVTDNPTQADSDTILQVTLPQILQDHGYYTGLIGKYHVSKHPQPGFDFWMEVHGSDYTDTKYNINGTTITIPGHSTDVVSDSAIGFFQKVPQDKPFYLWLAYAAPHTPQVPRPEDNGLFDGEVMPEPASPAKYTENYPGIIYNCHTANNPDGLDDYWRGYFELLNGVEETLGNVFDELTNMGLMDSTLIIFMSDNGYMIGEHKLFEKQMAYEESIKVPLFMRYPGLIPAGTEVTDNLAMNIDIAPTILDFAGITDTFGMQGVSLLKMMNNEVERKEMMYEFFNKDCVPDIRAVRSLDYKYVSYNCNQVTEELFDLVNDSLETTNLVNEPEFATVLQQYRDKLTFWRNYYQDYSWDSLYTCSLTNPQKLSGEPGNPISLLSVYPNPSSDALSIHFISEEEAPVTIRIMNSMGFMVYENQHQQAVTTCFENLDADQFPAGTYVVMVQQGDHVYRQSFVRQ